MKKNYNVKYIDDNKKLHLLFTAEKRDVDIITERFQDNGPILVQKNEYKTLYSPIVERQKQFYFTDVQ